MMKPPKSDKNLKIFHLVKKLFTEVEEELTPAEQAVFKDEEDEEWEKYLWMIISGEE